MYDVDLTPPSNHTYQAVQRMTMKSILQFLYINTYIGKHVCMYL